MPQIEPYVRVRYWGVTPTPDLQNVIAESCAKLSPLRAQIELCELHVGRWNLHDEQGFVYRVSVSLARKGGGHGLAIEDETDPNPPQSARDQLVSKVVARAAARLAAL